FLTVTPPQPLPSTISPYTTLFRSLRTTNPIESTFATVRHRTIRSRGCLSNKTALAMVFKLVETAQRSWRRLDGHVQLPKLILGVKFADGLERRRRRRRSETWRRARPTIPTHPSPRSPTRHRSNAALTRAGSASKPRRAASKRTAWSPATTAI